MLRPGVERDVGHLAWLDAPNQFPNYVLPPDSRPKTRELYQNRRAEIKRDGLQIVYATGRCPPMCRLVTDCRSFHLQFTV